jgi:hypothetical protein
MIARVWHGFTTPEHADAYQAHLTPELLPGLSQKKGRVAFEPCRRSGSRQ